MSEHKDKLSSREEAYLRTAKEIAVKYIEIGRLPAANFSDTFYRLYAAVKSTVEGNAPPPEEMEE